MTLIVPTAYRRNPYRERNQKAIATGIGLLVVFYAVVMVKAGAKKQPKPGKDFDERGPYA